jgi:probable F420-dependent oxidoreductase
MKIGIQCRFGGQTATAAHIMATARLIEEVGFDALWVGEHCLFFHDGESAYPFSEDKRPPLNYNDLQSDVTTEPFTLLALAAGATHHLRLCTGASILAMRNPVYFAKQAADVDVISGGRLTVGIGMGWQAEEFDALGVPFTSRGARTDDYIDVVKTLWCDEISFHQGEYYRLPPSVMGPKPVQKPHPPIWYCGESDRTLRRVARSGQGWYGLNVKPNDVAASISTLHHYLDEAGRARSEVELAVSPYDAICDLDLLRRYQDAGIDNIVVMAFSTDPVALTRELEAFAESTMIHKTCL